MSKQIGVILAQVGTPEHPTPPALRRYLKAFLSDERIIDLPRWYWLPILYGFILPRRPAAVAPHYQDIWTKQGSPLLVYSQAQMRAVQKILGNKFKVQLGLAYAEPSIQTAIHRLEVEGIDRIVVLPLFPQFSTTTTASVYDEIMLQSLGRGARRGKPNKKYVPALRFIEPFYDDPTYIDVLSQDIKAKLKKLPTQPDKIIISYHGIPERYAVEGDPYPLHCQRTTELLVKAMGWKKSQYQMTYQSRFGREEWLKPYTQTVLPKLFGRGVERVAIVSPGFTTDCLETIHELGIEGAELFAEGGGQASSLHHISCLNDTPAWTQYLADRIKHHAQGWT